MEKENNYLATVSVEGELAAAGIDTTTRGRSGEGLMLHYMLNDDPMNSDMIIPSYQQQQQQQQRQQEHQDEHQVERNLSFADVMQFAESGPKLAQLQHEHQVAESHNLINRSDGDRQFSGVDPVSLLRFPVLGNQLLMQLPSVRDNSCNNPSHNDNDDDCEGMRGSDFGYMYDNPVQHEFLSNANDENFIDDLSTGDKTIMEGGQLGGRGGETSATDGKSSGNSKRKRPRTIKTSEEVESQRMTHIAVERNRRKQMNEHLRVLRSLMPSSYVQRGDQASIIGGAIEFVRELEQLLQCLESQKRRRLYGDQQVPTMGDSTSSSLALVQQQQQPQSPLGVPYPPPFPTNHHHHHEEQVQLSLVNDNHPQLDTYSNNNHNCSTSIAVEVGGGDSCGGSGLLMQEEMAESKSCIADVEVKVLGFDALIKILSRRRPSQLIKAIAALEDLQFSILHTNITTIEQTVLYSFNVKVGSEARFTAEDIANSVQQIFTFIHANTNI